MARKKATAAQESASLPKAIRMCLDSGKVLLGARDCIKMAMHGKGKLVIISSNMPKSQADDLRRFCSLSNLPALGFGGTSLELGSVCGKPFPVSALWIGEEGNSPILSFAKKKQ